jgi:hypothetical protein
MTTDELDPLIHVPARLRIVATLATLPEGDTLPSQPAGSGDEEGSRSLRYQTGQHTTPLRVPGVESGRDAAGGDVVHVAGDAHLR